MYNMYVVTNPEYITSAMLLHMGETLKVITS